MRKTPRRTARLPSVTLQSQTRYLSAQFPPPPPTTRQVEQTLEAMERIRQQVEQTVGIPPRLFR